MKLLNKTTIYFISVSLVIFCLGAILFYTFFEIIIDRDINHKLHERKTYHLKQFEKTDSLLLYQRYSANMIYIQRTGRPETDQEILSDTTIYDDVLEEPIAYRQLSFVKIVHGKNYFIQVRRAAVEHRALLEGVILLEGLLFLAFVAVLSIVNNKLSKRLWQPFYFILDKIGKYKVDLAQNLVLPKSNIEEFNELSKTIEVMTDKIKREFNIQKEFTENASHEIQTPLAIVKNKLEILLQSPELSKDQMDLINSASVAANRLSKLNEALIILSKIDNRQFHEETTLCINDEIDQLYANLEELVKMKELQVEKNYGQRLTIKMNSHLLRILLENLVTNSIKHNYVGGKINIAIADQTLAVSNTGEALNLPPEKLFHRFVKSNLKSPSLGLGLSILKAICDTYSFQIAYREAGGYHTVSVLFNPVQPEDILVEEKKR
ncbi:MAG: HAMP domain-containing histidine kinase [Bacteroidetes bacterium]|nr:HAMP domain-containing histidine kinase [Bacteroidota bacterium]MBS1540494.1 HAMP domain-containing histidine kinase [Bacteroidota bacterium]